MSAAQVSESARQGKICHAPGVITDEGVGY